MSFGLECKGSNPMSRGNERHAVVVGARCTWWDSIDKVGHTEARASKARFLGGGLVSDKPLRLPCCPHCSGVLYEFQDIDHWNESVESYVERSDDTNYPDLIAWSRGQCFPDTSTAREAWKAAGSPKRGRVDTRAGAGP